MVSKPQFAAIAIRLLLTLMTTAACLGTTDADGAQLTASWIDHSNGTAMTRLERRPGTGATFVAIADIPLGVTQYVDTSVGPDATYCYRALAYDAAGVSPYSDEACAMNALMTLAFTNPASGTTVSGTATVSLSASGGSGYTFTVKADGTTIYAGTNPSFAWNTMTAANGSHTLTATVTDGQNRMATATLPVTVSNSSAPPPTTTLSAAFMVPTAGAIVNGITTVGMMSSGASGSPTFRLAVDGTVVSTQTVVGTTTSYAWNTATAASGLRTLTLTVTDGAAQTATATLAVTVPNGAVGGLTVTNTSNSAAVAGSLPWAVQQANLHPGLDYIYFNIPGPGVHVITLSTTLFLNDQVVIDGKTQPGYAGSPLIYVVGTSNVTSLFLLQNASSGSTVQGLGLYGYTSNAVTVFSSSIGNWIQDNYMGFYADGVSPVSLNSSLFPLTRGIGLQSGFNTIRGNTISGVDNAIVIGEDPAGTWSGTVYKTNSIQGNRIGTNPAGDSAAGFGNTGDGLFLGAGARENFLGPNNVLSGNASSGVELFHPTVIGNVVFRNAIGVNAAGTAAIPNHELGVLLSNGANGNAVGGPFGGNVISANTLGGVSLGTALSAPFTSAANGNWVQNNIIGLNLSQSAAPGTQDVGVALSDGSTQNAVEGNVLAGNVHHGAQLFGVATNSVSNNWIGMSSTGVARANGGFGVYFHNASNNFATGNAFGVNTLGALGADGTSCCNVTN